MRKFLFCVFVLLVFSSLVEAQVIKIIVEKGQKYLLEYHHKTSDSSEIEGHPFQTTTENNRISVFEVISIGKNETILQVTTTRVISKLDISGILEMQQKNDSDEEDSISKMQSKIIGKPKKVVIDNNGYLVKQDNDEKIYIDNDSLFIGKQDGKGKYENPMKGWDFSRSQTPSDLFIPFFIGKEFKPGARFPYLDSFTAEKSTTSFSINKEKMDTRDSGTYTITNIENGIASISYIGTKIFSMQVNIMGKLDNSISKSTVRTQLQIDINTGMVMSKIVEEEAITYSGDNSKPPESTSKSATTIKVKLIQ
jgi:hypothetical protein